MLFSIIVPYRNREKFLKATLRSILEQQYRPLEVILVDNGSTDASAELCRRFMEKHACRDFRIRLLAEPGKGAARARNKGLSAAKGEYVYFFDSDDLMSPDFISDVHRVLESKRRDVVAAATCMVFPDGKVVRRKVFYNSSVRDHILTGMLSTQSFVVRTEFLREIGGWNDDVMKWNDWELGVRILLSKPDLCWIEHKAYHKICRHPDSLTGNSFSERIGDIRFALDTVKALVKPYPEAYFAVLARQAILAGQLRREHSYAASSELLAEIGHRVSRRDMFLFKILYLYCAYGGKGAWFLCRKFRSLWNLAVGR